MPDWKKEYCENCNYLMDENECRESPNKPSRDGGENACSKWKPQENKN